MSVEDIIYSVVEGHLRETSLGGMPAMIVDVSSYGDKQFVNVRPQISRLLETGEVISNDEITIYDVPVIWPSGGGAMLSFPLKVGDTVWLSFSQRNLEDWLYSDGTQEVIPGDSRHFSMTDAVAIPGLYTALSNLKPSTENVEIKFGNHLISLRPSGELYVTNGGAKITLKPDGNIEIDPSATLTILGNVEVQGTIHATQNISSDTDVLSAGISGKNHNHIGSPTAPSGPVSNTGAPV
jgi:hypothetical protein